MYNVDGFKPIYGKSGQFSGVSAGRDFFAVSDFKVWFQNIKRRMFVDEVNKIPLYHYADFSDDLPKYWFSFNHEDYYGLERIRAKEVEQRITKIKEAKNDI